VHVCVHVCMYNRRSAEAIWHQIKHWLISWLSSLKATERVLLKAHAAGLATSKNTGLLGVLDWIEMERDLVLQELSDFLPNSGV